MSFDSPYDGIQHGDFVYGIYAGTSTMVALETQGCYRVGTQYAAVDAAYDHMYKGPTPGNHRVKRISKVGLNLFVQNHITVHFVLDDIVMDQVPTKSYSAEDKNPDSRSITGAELRWIYRHRDHLDVQTHIQFWHKNQQCSPPWIKDGIGNYSANWRLYKPKDPTTTVAPDVSGVLVQRAAVPVPVPVQKKTCGCCTIL